MWNKLVSPSTSYTDSDNGEIPSRTRLTHAHTLHFPLLIECYSNFRMNIKQWQHQWKIFPHPIILFVLEDTSMPCG